MAKKKIVKKANGRPTKCTPHFLTVAEQVLNNDINSIILTDEELRLEINSHLPTENRICEATFKNWKAGILLDTIGEQFLALYKKALYTQKQNLFEKLRDDTQWQRYAWIIERKFDDWNLRNKQEHSGEVKTVLTQIYLPKQSEIKDGVETPAQTGSIS